MTSWQEAQKVLRKPFYERDTLCNLCGRHDLVFPVKTLHVCPSCLKVGNWEGIAGYDFRGGRKTLVLSRGAFAERSGICTVCKKPYNRGGLYVPNAMACFKCLWAKLGGKSGALRTDSGHLV